VSPTKLAGSSSRPLLADRKRRDEWNSEAGFRREAHYIENDSQ